MITAICHHAQLRLQIIDVLLLLPGEEDTEAQWYEGILPVHRRSESTLPNSLQTAVSAEPQYPCLQ